VGKNHLWTRFLKMKELPKSKEFPMAANLTDITNISSQVVPVLVNEIALANVNANSDMPSTTANQTQIAPGAGLTIETTRIDVGQLEQLQRLGLITFVSR
jgi:hypothetical protein